MSIFFSLEAKDKMRGALFSIHQNNMKENFIKKFGISLEMPVSYATVARFFPPDPSYIVLATHEIFPEKLEVANFIHREASGIDAMDSREPGRNIQHRTFSFRLLHRGADSSYTFISQRFLDPQEYHLHKIGIFGISGQKLALIRSPQQDGTPIEEIESKHCIDIFDCSQVSFFQRAEPLNIKDPAFEMTITNEKFQSMSSDVQMRFSETCQYLVLVYGKADLQIFDLDKEDPSEPFFEIEMPEEFEYLLDFKIQEKNLMNSYFVFKRDQKNKVLVVTLDWLKQYKDSLMLMENDEFTMDVLTYLNQNSYMQILAVREFNLADVMISFATNMQHMLFCSSGMCYLLHLEKEKYAIPQKLIQHLEGCQPRYVIPVGESDFALIHANNFDETIQVMFAQNKDFEYTINSSYGEGSVVICDAKHNSASSDIKVLLSKDDEEFLVCDVNQDFCAQDKFYMCSQYAFEWPYIVYQKGSDEVVIQNAFSTKKAYILKPPLAFGSSISKLFISPNLNLYIAISTKTEFLLYSYDLDLLKPLIVSEKKLDEKKSFKQLRVMTTKFRSDVKNEFSASPICRISKESIDNGIIYKYLVRDSKSKKMTKQVLERIIMVRYDYKLFHYTAEEKLEFVDHCHRLRQIDENLSLYSASSSSMLQNDYINFIQFLHSDYKQGTIYEEIEGKIDDFHAQAGRILLLTRSNKQFKSETLKVLTYDEKFEVVGVQKLIIHDQQLLGCFKLAQSLADMIFASQNRAYFVDVSYKVPKIYEYSEVLPLREGEIVLHSAPMVNLTYKKMLYFKVSKHGTRSKKAIILPYLNSNEIIFHVRHEELYSNFFQHQLTPTDFSEPSVLTYFPQKELVLLHTLRGQLREYFQLSKSMELYGKNLVCVSPDGQVFGYLTKEMHLALIRFTVDYEGREAAKRGDLEQMIQLEVVKKISKQLKPAILMDVIEVIHFQDIKIQLTNQGVTLQSTVLEQLKKYNNKQNELQFQINNHLDLSIGIREKVERTTAALKQLVLIKFKAKQAILFQAPAEVIQASSNNQVQERDEKDQLKNGLLLQLNKAAASSNEFKLLINLHLTQFKLLDQHILAWSKKQLFYCNINMINSRLLVKELQRSKLELASMKQSGEDSQIESVTELVRKMEEGGDVDEVLNLLVKIRLEDHAVFVKYNAQLEHDYFSLDASLNAQPFFNSDHDYFILDDGKVVDLQSKLPLLNYKFNFDPSFRVALEKGSKFTQCSTMRDLLLQNSIILPYSFQVHFCEVENVKNMKKIDPSVVYSYNGNTVLHQYADLYEQLKYLLKYYEKHNPAYLSMLRFRNSHGKTVLDVSLESENQKCVNLVFSFLEKTLPAFNCFDREFYEYYGSAKYLQACFFQTQQMKSVHTLAVSEFDPMFGLAVKEYHTCYFDRNFYSLFCDGHNSERTSIASCVEVFAIDVEWILKTKEGDQLLLDYSMSEDMKDFENDYIRVLVLFLWRRFKPKVIRQLFIPFLINFVLFNYYAIYAFVELRRFRDDPDPSLTPEQVSLKLGKYIFINHALMVLMLLFSIQIAYVEIKQMQFHRSYYLSSFWNVIDCTAAVLTPTVIILDFTNGIGDFIVRPWQAILVIIFHLRFFYFLRIFDSSAPFVRIILQITADIQIFMSVLFIGISGFGFAFYVLSMNNPVELQFIDSVVKSLLYSYQISLGDFSTDDFSDASNPILLWVFFLLASFFTLIILLNMLIAIMGDSFNRVRESEGSEHIRDCLNLVLENSFMVWNREREYRGVRYLIGVKRLEAEEKSQVEQVVETQMGLLKKAVKKNREVLVEIQKNQDTMMHMGENKMQSANRFR